MKVQANDDEIFVKLENYTMSARLGPTGETATISIRDVHIDEEIARHENTPACHIFHIMSSLSEVDKDVTKEPSRATIVANALRGLLMA